MNRSFAGFILLAFGGQCAKVVNECGLGWMVNNTESRL